MFHGLDNRHLYAAYRLACSFIDGRQIEITCTGTGFFVQTNNDQLVLITNRHVLDPGFSSMKYAGFRLQELRIFGKANDPSSGLPEIDKECVVKSCTLKYSEVRENDIACLGDLSVAPIDGSFSMDIDYWLPQELLATSADFESKFSTCDFVAFPGFPEWYDRRQHRPILRTGTISSDPRYDYSWSSEFEGECIAYEAFSYGGSSGSPVFAVQKGPRPGVGISFPGYRELKLIGINAGHLPAGRDSHSGISYMYKASAILAIIEAEPTDAWLHLTFGQE